MTRQPLRADTPRHAPSSPYAAPPAHAPRPAGPPYAAPPPQLRAAATPPQLRAVVPLGRHGWAQRHPATPGRVTLA
ncbi:hypothetical protein ACN6LI_008452, partial [Streptomyces violaceoruber]